MSSGIVAWGVYLPSWRLQRSAIGAFLGVHSGRGTRSVASYDEDTTTMGAEAGRRALAALVGDRPHQLFFSTPAPAYLDKTNATAVHAALGLDQSAGAYDMVGSSRSAIATLQAAEALTANGRTMAIISDLRTGPAGSAEERDSGDGAVAFVFGSDGAVAEEIARSTSSIEFLDRWRVPGEAESRVWEERFGQEVYVPVVDAAFADALKTAGIAAGEIDHVILAGLHPRAVKAVAGKLGVASAAFSPDVSAKLGNLGAAQAGVALADVLERATVGQIIAIVSVADGADVVLLRTTEALLEAQAVRADAGVLPVSALIELADDSLSYSRYLSWRGQIRRDPPRRPDPERPGAPATWRSSEWRGGFEASTCTSCGFRHLPPTRVCLKCHAVDQMEFTRLADLPGRVATFTIDRLAFSPSPPVIGVVVDFEGGGRYRCEITDVKPDDVTIGMPVEMTFRRIYTAEGGVHNYFWKARPVRTVVPAEAESGEGAQS